MQSAQKCIHCTSYQDWRSMIPDSAAIVSLVAALVAVGAAVIPPVYHWAQMPRSEIIMSEPGYSNGYITVFVSNTGKRPGLVQGASLSFYDEVSKRRAMVPMARGEGDLGMIISGGESALLSYIFAHNPYDLGNIRPTNCRVLFVTRNFTGQTELWDKSIECPKSYGFRVANFGPEPEFTTN
jgi:hypothetical protein